MNLSSFPCFLVFWISWGPNEFWGSLNLTPTKSSINPNFTLIPSLTNSCAKDAKRPQKPALKRAVATAEAQAFAAQAAGTTSGPGQVQGPDVKKVKVDTESLPIPEGGGLGRKCKVSNGSNVVLT